MTFLNDFDAMSDFGKNFVREKLVPMNHSYLNYALSRNCSNYIFEYFEDYNPSVECNAIDPSASGNVSASDLRSYSIFKATLTDNDQ